MDFGVRKKGIDQWHFCGWKPEEVLSIHMGVEPKIGGKKTKWMVDFMENPINMGWFGGTTIFGNTHISLGWTNVTSWWVFPPASWNACAKSNWINFPNVGAEKHTQMKAPPRWCGEKDIQHWPKCCWDFLLACPGKDDRDVWYNSTGIQLQMIQTTLTKFLGMKNNKQSQHVVFERHA